MLSFDIEEFSQAFKKVGYIHLRIGGTLHPVAYSTENYDKARNEWIRECPRPVREPVKTKVVAPDSDIGKLLGLRVASPVEFYSSDDFIFTEKDRAHSAELGRYLAAHCLNIELKRDGEPLTVKGKLVAFKGMISDVQANQITAVLFQAQQLDTQERADFFGGSSESSGEKGSAHQDAKTEE